MQTYKQIEALIWLTTQIKFRLPLPSMRGWAISPDFALILFSHVQEFAPRTVIELGGGVSTLVTGYALEMQAADGDNGACLISIDHAGEFLQRTQHHVTRHALAPYVRFIHAPLQPVNINAETWEWYALHLLQFEAEIDLLVVDGPPQYNNPQPLTRYPALPVFFDRLKSGGFVLVDDADRDDERRMVERWLTEFDLCLVERFDTEKGTVLLRKNGV